MLDVNISIIILVVMLTVSSVNSPEYENELKTYDLNYTVDTSNSLIKNDSVLGYKLFDNDETDVESCTEEIIDRIFKDFEYNYDKSFNVHLIDRTGEVWGLAYKDSIIVFDNGKNDMYSEYESVVLHEFGHLVYNSLSKSDVSKWKKFRGIPKEWTDSSDYTIRPTEIFARDFVYLFGVRYGSGYFAYGNYYTPPYEIEGLKEYIIKLGKQQRNLL